MSMFEDSAVVWDYRVEQLSHMQMSNQLNFMGKDGWELVAVVFNGDDEYPYQCFLKRAKPGRY